MFILAVLLLGFLTLLNYRTGRDVGYPPFLMSGLWLLVMVLYCLAPIRIYAIGFVTALIFVVTVVSFSAGGLLVFHGRSGSYCQALRTPQGDASPAHPWLKTVLLLATVIMLPLMFSHASEIVELSGMNDFFTGLRTELSSEDSVAYGVLLNNAGLLSYFTTFLYAVEVGRGLSGRVQYHLSLLVSLIYAVFSTGRTPVLLILLGLTGIALMRKRLTAFKVIAGVLVFLVFFASFAVILRKGGDPDSTWSENIASTRDTLFVYAVGALPAFDRVVRQNAPLALGENTLSGLFNIFYHLSGHRLISPIQETVSVPFETNVYTGIQPVYKDFGIVGVVLVFAFIGAATTHFYVAGARGDRLHMLYYALALFPLVSMLFTDQYFVPFSVWVRLFFAGYLYFRVGANVARRSSSHLTQAVHC